MKPTPRAVLPSLLCRLTRLAIAVAVVAAPLPVVAAPPAEKAATAPAEPPATAPAEAAAAEPAGEVGGKVAMLRFSGADTEAGNEIRLALTEQLQERGYEVKGVARTVEESAAKVKCKAGELDTKCLDRVGEYLDKNAKTHFDFFVYGNIEPPDSGRSQIVIWSTAKKEKAVDAGFQRSSDDFILGLALPKTIAGKLAAHQRPPGPMTEEEQQIIATLDEPLKTEEELAAEQKKLEEAEKQRLAAFDDAQLAAKKDVDLKAEFDKFCRKGPREDQTLENEDGTTTTVRDLRPPCARGPFWGYWQPRAYVALVLAGGLAVTTGVFYGLALGAHLDWKQAKDDLDASGLSKDDPNATCDADGVCYKDLAGKVSEDGARVRRLAILGDVFLGATVLMTGILGIIIGQDRAAAKGYLIQQKDLALNVGPLLGHSTFGAGAHMRF